jgi:hypothetical protein
VWSNICVECKAERLADVVELSQVVSGRRDAVVDLRRLGHPAWWQALAQLLVSDSDYPRELLPPERLATLDFKQELGSQAHNFQRLLIAVVESLPMDDSKSTDLAFYVHC